MKRIEISETLSPRVDIGMHSKPSVQAYEKVLAGANPGQIADEDHGEWYGNSLRPASPPASFVLLIWPDTEMVLCIFAALTMFP